MATVSTLFRCITYKIFLLNKYCESNSTRAYSVCVCARAFCVRMVLFRSPNANTASAYKYTNQSTSKQNSKLDRKHATKQEVDWTTERNRKSTRKKTTPSNCESITVTVTITVMYLRFTFACSRTEIGKLMFILICSSNPIESNRNESNQTLSSPPATD